MKCSGHSEVAGILDSPVARDFQITAKAPAIIEIRCCTRHSFRKPKRFAPIHSTDHYTSRIAGNAIFDLKRSIPSTNNGIVFRAGHPTMPTRDLTRPMDEKDELRKSEELRSFLFLTVVMVPVLTVLIIAAYGFAVWFYQMLIGGPPHH
jgi:periplasmic nitrate reductase NapE